MKCYVDSSVLLRRLLRQKGGLAEWSRITQPFASRLVRLECLRTIERLSLRGLFPAAAVAQVRQACFALVDTMGLLPLTEQIYQRAEEPFATPLGSLDALHLATAILWREMRGEAFTMATHDLELAMAARAHGFMVIGAE